MTPQTPRFLLAAGLLVLTAATAWGFAPADEAERLEIKLRETPPIVNPEEWAGAREVASDLSSRLGGSWHVHLWNPLSETPQAVYGSGVQLSTAPLSDDRTAVEAATGFIASNADLLGVVPQDLVLERVARGVGKVAVHFVQRYQGLPVSGTRVRLIFTEGGRLFVFGATFFRDIGVSPAPSLGAAAAEGVARAALPFNPSTDSVLRAAELLVLPVPGEEGGVEHHLAWETVVGTADPYGVWITHVDAHDGSILARTNDVHNLYSGTVQGDVDQSGYCDGQQTSPFRNMTVSVSGLGSTTSDSTGAFSIAGTGGPRTVSCEFNGPHLNVNDVQFGDATFSGTIQENVPLTINWTDATPSRRAERDVFYWTNETHDYVKQIDPTWSIPAHTANVNVNSSCNANWTTWHMNFFREGGGCGNTGTIGDVVAHEYGHGIQHTLLGFQGNQGLGEGNSDISGTFMIDDSVIGRGFNLNQCGAGIRDCLNTLRYPENVVGQPIHSAGRVICGFNWDARGLLETKLGAEDGKTYTAQLWHFARKLYVPDLQPEQVLAYFVVDDDDGDLDNGTPNHDEICQAATNHGFECPEILVGVIIGHTPLRSTTDHANPYTVEAEITSTEAAIVEAQLFYRVDGGPFQQVEMTTALRAPYTADIPAQALDASIEYYIFARDALDNERTHPPSAPAILHQFFVATILDELEVASGWTVGAPGDNATTGVWERVDPVGTGAQPEDDHTPDPGVICFVTGQHIQGQGIGFNDVDNGTTTLLSPVWDLSAATAMARVIYYRWYSNNQGADPNNDIWVVDVSNDGGGTWTNVENVNPPGSQQNTWIKIEVDLIALFGTPDQVKFRFVASDLNAGSIVEAAVDDVVILTRGGAAAVEGPAAGAAPIRFAVGPNQPNPFNPATTITYTLAERAGVAVTVFDPAGREVRVLRRGVEDAGEHVVGWDGRDAEGRLMPSGVYYYRVEAGGREATRKMVLVR